jgi:hypothetical protein
VQNSQADTAAKSCDLLKTLQKQQQHDSRSSAAVELDRQIMQFNKLHAHLLKRLAVAAVAAVPVILKRDLAIVVLIGLYFF